MDPDQTVRMRRLVWIHAGRKPIMLVLSYTAQMFNETEATQKLRNMKSLHLKIK
jgi:hypothetical protein